MSERPALKPAVLIGKLGGFRGDAYHVRLSEAVKGRVRIGASHAFQDVLTHDVAVSSIDNEFGKETLIFPADPDGKPLSFVDIVAIREYDHVAALAALGFEITD